MSNFILYPLIALGGLFVVVFIYNFFKASKDPDVKAASALHMTIGRYNLYKELFEKHQAAMSKYGIHSKEATEMFIKEINPRIPNPNEWRRFCEYQTKLEREKMFKEFEDY